MTNTDDDGQKHAQTRDKETKGGVSKANGDEGGQSTHFLEMKRQRWV
jgi:hypothetical protein